MIVIVIARAATTQPIERRRVPAFLKSVASLSVEAVIDQKMAAPCMTASPSIIVLIRSSEQSAEEESGAFVPADGPRHKKSPIVIRFTVHDRGHFEGNA